MKTYFPSFALVLLMSCLSAQDSRIYLQLEKTITMPRVEGRIDHLSIDVQNERLFVAALGNNSLEVIDLKSGNLARSIPGLHEPQGVLYVPEVNRLYVANRKSGNVNIFDASSFTLLKTVAFGSNADNLRYDAAKKTVYVGYGFGALAGFSTEGARTAEIKLDAHPESFQIERNGGRIFVNVPNSRKIAVLDRQSKTLLATWNTGGPEANFPMAFDEEHGRLFVVCRSPARLVVLDAGTGKIIQSLPVVGDSDDVFYDRARSRIYAIGGEGAVSVIEQHSPDAYRNAATIKTSPGARTGLFSPDLKRLYVAARREGSAPAAIHVYRVQ